MTDKKLQEKNTLYNPVFLDNWETHNLYLLAEWLNGMAFKNFNFSEKGRPVIKIAEVKNGISGQTKFTDKEYENKYLLKKDDMLFCWSGQPQTSIDVFWWNGPDGWLNQHIFKVTPKLENKYFFFYLLKYLKQNFIKIAINKQTTGLGHVTKGDLEKMVVKLPKTEEQKAIASVLSAFDDKIELLREQNKTLEELGQTIFQEWFGKYGVDDFIKAQEILEFEKGVEVGSKNYFENKNDLENPEMFYRVGDVSNNGNNSSLYCEKDLLKNRIFKKDDVLVSFDGTVGRVFIGGNGGYSSGIRKIYAKNGNIKNSFLYFWAKSEQAQETINLYSEGTTIQHAGKSIPYLEIISNQEYIDEITESLNPVFIKFLENLDQIRILSSTRDEILPKLMSGQVRVNDFNNN